MQCIYIPHCNVHRCDYLKRYQSYQYIFPFCKDHPNVVPNDQGKAQIQEPNLNLNSKEEQGNGGEAGVGGVNVRKEEEKRERDARIEEEGKCF